MVPGKSRRLELLVVAVLVLLAADVVVRLDLFGARAVLGQESGGRIERREKRRDATVRAVMKAGPAVANISTERIVKARSPWGRRDVFDEFFDSFLGRGQQRKARSLGSGIIVDASGYIFTNAHVVAQASRILVTLPDNTNTTARLINLSQEDDLALLKVEAEQALPIIAFGRSRDLMIGETVISLGNPFGLENTVTRGVVSARDRRIIREGRTLPGTFLQTDAAINPGNSGGPLINLDAELVGINTAVHATGQGIGFAIPIDRVRRVLGKLSSPDRLRDFWLGLELEEKEGRIEVQRVIPGSAAAQANLTRGDVLKSLDGEALDSVFKFNKRVLEAKLDQELALVLERDRALYRTNLRLQLKPSIVTLRRRLGLELRSLGPTLAAGGAAAGVLVREAVAGGPAARIGVKEGDVLIKLGRIVVDPRFGRIRRDWRIDSVDALVRLLEDIPAGAEVTVFIRREGRELMGEVKLR